MPPHANVSADTSQVARLPIEVREAVTSREKSIFVQFPWRIYAEDPFWVPPLLVEEQAFIDHRRHPFYQHGEARQLFAWRGAEVGGRISVSDDPRYNAQHNDNAGMFGQFESINNPTVAHAMLDAAADWLRQRGRNRLLGPINYSTNYPCGLLIEGFDTPPRLMMNHQPRYYRRLLESWGLAHARDMYCWWYDDHRPVRERFGPRVERLMRRGAVRVRSFRMDDFEADVRRCQAIYNEALENNWGSVRMTDAEFHHLACQIRRFAEPRALLFAEIDGQPVGFSMMLPDVNEALRPLNGRLTRYGLPLGLWRLARGLKRIRTGRLLAFGVREGYRRRGIAEMLIFRTLQIGADELNYTGAELGWTLEDNELINRAIETAGGRHYKTYRTYQRDLA